MRSAIILSTLAFLLSVTALQPGDVPIEIAVRSDAYVCSPLPCEAVLKDRNGNIRHFYKRDEEEYFQKRGFEERQVKDLSKDPQSDTYAVQADAGGNLAPL
jgi:hypothetical protein